MLYAISGALPYAVLFSHVLLVGLVFAFIFRHSWGKDVFDFVGRKSLILAFGVSSLAILGSLFYSDAIGFEPCVLCWWQRVFLYPTALIFGISIWKKFNNAWDFSLPLIALAGVVALYQTYANLGGTSLLSCTGEGGGCDRLYVSAFGYITIPTMSLTMVAYLLVIYMFSRVYKSQA